MLVKPKYITIVQAETYSGIHTSTLRELAIGGHITSYKVNGCLSFDTDDLDTYMASFRSLATAEAS